MPSRQYSIGSVAGIASARCAGYETVEELTTLNIFCGSTMGCTAAGAAGGALSTSILATKPKE